MMSQSKSICSIQQTCGTKISICINKQIIWHLQY